MDDLLSLATNHASPATSPAHLEPVEGPELVAAPEPAEGSELVAGPALAEGSPPATELNALAGHLVALLFVSSEPLALEAAAQVLEVERPVLEATIAVLQQAPPPGLLVQRNNDHVMLATAPTSSAYVERLLGRPEVTRLSRAALEVLALVAYRQPITRAEVDALRGVNSDSAVATLLARGLIAEVGRRDTVGHPVLLGTAPEFLRYLGIASVEELPPLAGFAPNGHEADGGERQSFSLSR